MQLSLESKFCLSACAVLGTYNAYSNPANWLTGFFTAIIVGAFEGRKYLTYVNNPHGGSTEEKNATKQYEIIALTTSLPGLITTAILALELLENLYPSVIKIQTYWGSFLLGYSFGKMFQLERLSRNPDIEIQRLLANTVI